ncbi:MAG: trypsin-like peptidase domain-containing protein, partial [Anaerolineae bacterium]|nr:trypsin-like peptidase domain-containing protein [Anaerolineae bacterium]
DDDSDLAVIKVGDVPDDVHPLQLGDSDQVQVGEWVIAIGSPFGLGSTMTLGIVSARGRTIPSGVTPFSIPEAIQTDAAINPGNSGGPLLNLRGEVIGVNAQIANSGVRANAGVGFAIPVNTVRRVAPVLIENGVYVWPWLGVSGGSISMVLQEANELASQQGAYIASVSEGGPADDAGLRGATRTIQIDGGQIPVGGDVVIAIDGVPVANFDELLREIAKHLPGDQVELTILRDGRELNLNVELEARPQDFG